MRNIYTIIFTLLIQFSSGICFSQEKISIENLKRHIAFLASDSLKGRKPGTIESTIAAQYIADEFKQNKLKLLGNNGFQYFDVKTGVKAGENICKLGKNNLSFNKDFTVLSYSENASIKSQVVFVGYGFNIQRDTIKWNDYNEIDVKGKLVLILLGNPDEDNVSGPFIEYSRERSKILTARDKGAAGVIFVSPVAVNKKDELMALKTGRSDEKCGLPVVQIKRDVANEILKKSGYTIESLETAFNMHRKPISFDTKKIIELKTEVNYTFAKTENIVALFEGNDSLLKTEYIVIGAHFDHLGFGGPGSGSIRPDTLAVHNGADDNASGVASIIEIAHNLSTLTPGPKRSILFISFGAEELGTLGSNYFVKNPLVDIKKIYGMLNLDMVGHLNEKTNELIVFGTGTAKEWEEILNPYQKSNHLKLSYSPEGNGASDHASFYAQNIPSLHFFTGTHENYHSPADDLELINFKGQSEVTAFVCDLLVNLANRGEKLTFQETGSKDKKSSRGGLKVKLDLMPDFSSTGNTGLKVNSVTKDGRAYKAGIEKGDIITSINGDKVLNIEDYMSRLQKYKPGDRIKVEILRGEEVKVFEIDL